jgi:hypothetical protein
MADFGATSPPGRAPGERRVPTHCGNSTSTLPFLKLGCGQARTPAPRRERGELGQGRVRAARRAAWMPFTETGPIEVRIRGSRDGTSCQAVGQGQTVYPVVNSLLGGIIRADSPNTRQCYTLQTHHYM